MKTWKKMVLVLLMAGMPLAVNAEAPWKTVHTDRETVVSVNTATARYDTSRDYATADVLAKDLKTGKEALLSYQIDYAEAEMRLASVRNLETNQMEDLSDRFEKDWHAPYGVELAIFQKVESITERDKKQKKKEKREERDEERADRQETRDRVNDGVDMVDTIDHGVRTVGRILRGGRWYTW